MVVQCSVYIGTIATVFVYLTLAAAEGQTPTELYVYMCN